MPRRRYPTPTSQRGRGGGRPVVHHAASNDAKENKPKTCGQERKASDNIPTPDPTPTSTARRCATSPAPLPEPPLSSASRRSLQRRFPPVRIGGTPTMMSASSTSSAFGFETPMGHDVNKISTWQNADSFAALPHGTPLPPYVYCPVAYTGTAEACREPLSTELQSRNSPSTPGACVFGGGSASAPHRLLDGPEGTKKRVNALASRFLEPAQHDPTLLPEDLYTGPKAFATAASGRVSQGEGAAKEAEDKKITIGEAGKALVTTIQTLVSLEASGDGRNRDAEVSNFQSTVLKLRVDFQGILESQRRQLEAQRQKHERLRALVVERLIVGKKCERELERRELVRQCAYFGIDAFSSLSQPVREMASDDEQGFLEALFPNAEDPCDFDEEEEEVEDDSDECWEDSDGVEVELRTDASKERLAATPSQSQEGWGPPHASHARSASAPRLSSSFSSLRSDDHPSFDCVIEIPSRPRNTACPILETPVTLGPTACSPVAEETSAPTSHVPSLPSFVRKTEDLRTFLLTPDSSEQHAPSHRKRPDGLAGDVCSGEPVQKMPRHEAKREKKTTRQDGSSCKGSSPPNSTTTSKTGDEEEEWLEAENELGIPVVVQAILEDFDRKTRQKQQRGTAIQAYPKEPPTVDGVASQRVLKRLKWLSDRYRRVSEEVAAQHGTEEANGLIRKRKKEIREFAGVIHAEAKQVWAEFAGFHKRLRRYMHQRRSDYGDFMTLGRGNPLVLLNFLGKGGFAEVWEAVYTHTWEMKAVKITELDESLTAEQQEFLLSATYTEVSLQRRLEHPHIVEMQQCFEISARKFAAALDLCEGPDLDRLIASHGPVPEALAKVWIRQLITGVQYIHEVGGVVHFDLKPHNILLHKGMLKISDFGLHQPFDSHGVVEMEMNRETNQVGTLWYMPPEHIKAALLQKKSEFDGRFDMWSVGVILYEMLFQRRPFGQGAGMRRPSYEQLGALIYSEFVSQGLRFPPSSRRRVSSACRDFLRCLLVPVEVRLTARQALAHPYLNAGMRSKGRRVATKS